MIEKEIFSSYYSKYKPCLYRLLLLLFTASFLMPFLSVKGCSSKKTTLYYGYELITMEYGFILLIPIGLMLGLFIISFLKKRLSQANSAFLAALKALVVSLGGFIIFYIPVFQFLFDEIKPKVGQIIALLCCILIFSDSIIQSIKTARTLLTETKLFPLPKKSKDKIQYIVHSAVICILVAIIPLYLTTSDEPILLLISFLIFLSLPSIILQFIVLLAIKRSEKWVLWWNISKVIAASSFFLFFLWQTSCI